MKPKTFDSLPTKTAPDASDSFILASGNKGARLPKEDFEQYISEKTFKTSIGTMHQGDWIRVAKVIYGSFGLVAVSHKWGTGTPVPAFFFFFFSGAPSVIKSLVSFANPSFKKMRIVQEGDLFYMELLFDKMSSNILYFGISNSYSVEPILASVSTATEDQVAKEFDLTTNTTTVMNAQLTENQALMGGGYDALPGWRLPVHRHSEANPVVFKFHSAFIAPRERRAA